MTQFVFANNAATTVGSTFSALATTLAVATGTGILFPTPGTGQQFAITLSPAGSTTGTPFEICYVTGVSGDTFTVVRAQEGTVALSWAVGDFVQNRWTEGQAAALAQQIDVQKQTGNYAADTGTANAVVVTLNPVPASMSALVGVPIRFLKATTNTASVTINPNGLGPVTILFPGGSVLPAGALVNGSVYEVIFDGTNAELQSNSSLAYPATIAAGTILSNFTGGSTIPSANTLAATLLALGFVTSIAAHGYLKIPDGAGNQLLVQWGFDASDGTGNLSVFFGVTFSQLFSVVPGIGNAAAPVATVQLATTADNGFTATTWSGAVHTGPFGVYWIAIGEA